MPCSDLISERANSICNLFITFEGPEGSGKSTQARRLDEYLRGKGVRVCFTREPGGTHIGEEIRDIVHHLREEQMAAETELLLYSAARAQVVREIIRPALARGELVICDRYADSTLAYQGYGRGLDPDFLRRLTEFATGGLRPDLTFYVDVTVEEGLRRRQAGHAAGEELNRMDRQTREFYERVRAGYAELIKRDPTRWVYIDGMQSVDAVQAELRARMNAALTRATT